MNFERWSLTDMGGVFCPCCGSSRDYYRRGDNTVTVYRKSFTSVTFRCSNCTIQWSVTYVKMHHAAMALAAKSDLAGDEICRLFYENVITSLEPALERESRRKNSIRRQPRAA